jgi:hypothetical protein
VPLHFTAVVRSAVIILAGCVSVSVVMAQDTAAPVLAEQLRTRYKLVKLSQDANGLAVAEPGTVLVLQKSGILGILPVNIVTCPAKYQDGELHPPSGFCAAMVKQSSRFFQSGEKVYPSKIEVNVKKEQVSFRIVACDSCNATDPPTFFKSEVLFQFPKGYLETAAAGPVEATINQVLSDGAGAVAPPAAPAPPAPLEAPAAPADQPTKIIELGQTTDQVIAILGKPQKIAKVGPKEIYFYPDMKVTFTNGKVSDVE